MHAVASAESDPGILCRLKPGNGARVGWQYPDRRRTAIALLYLHGFSASAGEAGDLPEFIADGLAANLYVHRWPGHGMDDPLAMQGMTVTTLQHSALQALHHANALGDQVVIVGMSMGASLALQLAAAHPQHVAALAVWSPGIRAAQPWLLDQFCAASDPVADTRPKSESMRALSTSVHHPDGFRALRALFDCAADDAQWLRIVCPVFMAYFRGDDGREDPTASVPAMLRMFDALGVPAVHKRAQAFDAGVHAIGSPHRSPVAREVAEASLQFLHAQLRSGGR